MTTAAGVEGRLSQRSSSPRAPNRRPPTGPAGAGRAADARPGRRPKSGRARPRCMWSPAREACRSPRLRRGGRRRREASSSCATGAAANNNNNKRPRELHHSRIGPPQAPTSCDALAGEDRAGRTRFLFICPVTHDAASGPASAPRRPGPRRARRLPPRVLSRERGAPYLGKGPRF